MRYVVLDTDVASLSLRSRLTPTMTTRLTGSVWFVTFVTVGELCWADARSWGRRSRGELDDWLAPLATRNARDFEDYAEHDGLVLVTG